MTDEYTIEDVKRLRLEPGDVLVLRIRNRLSEAAIAHIREGMVREFPGHKVMVLEDGAHLDVVTPARIEST